jgi:hypothetical protein
LFICSMANEFMLSLNETPLGCLSYTQEVMCMGSCFAQNIGERLSYSGIQTTVNPNGIVYNSRSIWNAVHRMHRNEVYVESDLFQQNELFVSFEHHGRFSSINQEDAIRAMNAEFEEGRSALSKPKSIFIITLGSSNVYTRHGQVVANCHKLPARDFEKRTLSIDEIESDLKGIVTALPKEATLILTVSPVRYIKDGLIQNARSKARLIEASHRVVDAHQNVHYFPSYELVTDVLRDYRFFTSDRVHPTTEAINYVWKAFVARFYDAESQNYITDVADLNRNLNHRLLHPKTKASNDFAQSVLGKCDALEQKYGRSFAIEKKDFLLKNNIRTA